MKLANIKKWPLLVKIVAAYLAIGILVTITLVALHPPAHYSLEKLFLFAYNVLIWPLQLISGLLYWGL